MKAMPVFTKTSLCLIIFVHDSTPFWATSTLLHRNVFLTIGDAPFITLLSQGAMVCNKEQWYKIKKT